MATGISKTKWRGKPASTPLHHPSSNLSLGVSLSYNGKRDEREVLITPPAITQQIKSGGASDNASRLYFGDNLPILASLLHDRLVRGNVRLVYVDPPFATKSVFQSRSQADAYSDLLAGAHYIEFLRERLIVLRELLADDGSIYIHLDDNMAFHIKVIMDEVFGGRNFRNWITRKKCNPKNYTRKAYGNIADYILFYTKSENYVWNRPLEQRADNGGWPKEYRYIEEGTGRRYMKVPVHAPGERNGETGKPWRGMLPPPGKHWQYTPTTLDAMDARGEIYWSARGNPRRKVYLDENQGIPVQDIWLDYRDAHNQNIKITGYPTEKNPEMLAQIIRASSNPGDIVLDCFAGSGATLAAASRLGRRWIGVDNSIEAITTTLRRFAKGVEPMGDYVSSQKSSSGQLLRAKTLPLFPEEILPPPKANEQEIVTDFDLFAAEPYEGELETAIGTWLIGGKA